MGIKGIRFTVFLLSLKVVTLCIMVTLSIFIIYPYFSSNSQLGELGATDYIVTSISTALSVFVSIFLSLQFASRITPSITSIASAARLIAEGKLHSRADKSKHRIRELDLLVDDFNLMASRLEAMSEEMKVWNASIAHELRTPVTVLRSYIQGIRDGVINADENNIAGLLGHTESLGRLIDEVRILSLADSGQLKIYSEYADLSYEIENLVETLRPQFLIKNKTLISDIGTGKLYIDAHRLKQCALALLNNSLDYSQPGFVKLSCHLNDGVVILKVEDEGPGISPAQSEKIFEAFHRLDSGTKRDTGSSGLGLAVVKAIASAMGGKAEYKVSELGGSCFSVTFPVE